MAHSSEIKSEKILLKDVFSMWFQIPEYQRPYIWTYEPIHDLLDDLTFAATSKPDAEYFLGSLVFQAKPADKSAGRAFDENDLLDGQQRLTTLILLLAVLRDLAVDPSIKDTCQSCIYQKADHFKHIPERMRLEFSIRENVRSFFETFVKPGGGTIDDKELRHFSETAHDISVQNMATAISVIREFLCSPGAMEFGSLLEFVLNKVIVIYVSTEDLEDAFRLFTILNNRGIPLRNSDILKSINLGELENDADKKKYAKMWEEAEGELGDDFDRFLAYLRTILLKDKARLSLLREFEDKIYAPKEKDKETGKAKPILLQKGKPTFKLVERYLAHYQQLFGGSNYEVDQSWAFDNLVKVMTTGLPSSDWVPPLLAYYDKFREIEILGFIHKLNSKFAGDWLGQRTPTDRIEAMNEVINVIDAAAKPDDVLGSTAFRFDPRSFLRAIEGDVYGKRFALYVMMILDFVFHDKSQKMHCENLSIEHILPQTPEASSEWVKLFNDEDRKKCTDVLGNLVLITRRKNSSQGRLDYAEKISKYFQKNIDTCPNSLRVLKKYSAWTPEQVAENQATVLEELSRYFALPRGTT
jgi:hypothetical protein